VKRDAVLNVFGKWTEKVLKWRRQEERSRHARQRQRKHVGVAYTWALIKLLRCNAFQTYTVHSFTLLFLNEWDYCCGRHAALSTFSSNRPRARHLARSVFGPRALGRGAINHALRQTIQVFIILYAWASSVLWARRGFRMSSPSTSAKFGLIIRVGTASAIVSDLQVLGISWIIV